MTRKLLLFAAGVLLLGACNKVQRTPPLTENKPLVPNSGSTGTTEGKNTQQGGTYNYQRRTENPYF